MSAQKVTIQGRRHGAGPIHDFRSNYPRRIVVARTPIGWNRCARCGREHRIWMTDDHTWLRVPREWRGERICVRCFRVLAPRKRAGR